MWFDILKETKQTSRQIGSLNWDEEMVSDSEEEDDCFKKILKIWEYVKTTPSMFEKNRITDMESDYYYWHASTGKGVITYEFEVRGFDKFTEKQACDYLEELRKSCDALLTNVPYSNNIEYGDVILLNKTSQIRNYDRGTIRNPLSGEYPRDVYFVRHKTNLTETDAPYDGIYFYTRIFSPDENWLDSDFGETIKTIFTTIKGMT